MVFSSAVFLFLFLPVLCALYYIVPGTKAKNIILVLFSLIFYCFGNITHLPLLLASILVNWGAGRVLGALDHKEKKKVRKLIVTLAVALNIAVLAVFKYADFFVENVNGIFGAGWTLPGIALPLGISFFTFTGMSYVIEVYRKPSNMAKSLWKVMLYISLLPNILSGPILSYKVAAPQIDERVCSAEKVAQGLRRFILGMAKKVLVADVVGGVVDAIYASAVVDARLAWLGVIGYAIQIYFDFSGYSDMAIGLGRVFGFHFPENFRHPYVSGSITEFWRRWHITLSGWFRDYVYIPLGGRRVGRARWMLNLLIVWALTGLWHGSGTGVMNFILWGALYGILLCLEKLFLGKIFAKYRPIGHLTVVLVTLFGFVLFGANGLSGALSDLWVLFGKWGLSDPAALYYWRSGAVLILVAILGATPLPKKVWALIEKRYAPGAALLQPLLIGLALAISTAYIVDSSFNPFLYFRF